jgi:hypothetical protein
MVGSLSIMLMLQKTSNKFIRKAQDGQKQSGKSQQVIKQIVNIQGLQWSSILTVAEVVQTLYSSPYS